MHNSTENANGTGARPKTQKQFEGFHKERASPINQRVFPRTDEERPDGGDYDDDDADQHYSFCQRDFKDEFPSYRHSGAHGKAFPEGIFWSDSKNLNQNANDDANDTGARRKTKKQPNEFLKEMELRLSSDFPPDQLETPIQRQAIADENSSTGGDDYEDDNTCKLSKQGPTTSEVQSQQRAQTVDDQALMKLLHLITDEHVYTLLRMIPCVTKSLPHIGLYMAFIDSLFPDEKHDAVLRWFEKLSQQLRTESRELANMIKMESVCVLYAPDVVLIQKAIGSLTDIAKARDDKERHLERFKELCSGQKHELAMNNLIEGLRSKGTLQINILDRYYNRTGGHLRKVELLAKELLQLVCGGLTVVSTYETLVRGENFANKIFEKYTHLMDDARDNIERVFKRCKTEHKDNMVIDMNNILDSNVSNREAVDSLSSFMSEKYYWLENYCIVCNECIYMEYCFEGNYVSSFKRNGRFGVVFYQDAREKAIDPKRPNQIKIAFGNLDRFTWSTVKVCDELLKSLQYLGIDTYGCAVIKPKLWFFLIPYYSLYALYAYHSTLGTLQEKGSSSTAIHYWQNCALHRLNRPDYSEKPLSFPLKPCYHLVLWK